MDFSFDQSEIQFDFSSYYMVLNAGASIFFVESGKHLKMMVLTIIQK